MKADGTDKTIAIKSHTPVAVEALSNLQVVSQYLTLADTNGFYKDWIFLFPVFAAPILMWILGLMLFFIQLRHQNFGNVASWFLMHFFIPSRHQTLMCRSFIKNN